MKTSMFKKMLAMGLLIQLMSVSYVRAQEVETQEVQAEEIPAQETQIEEVPAQEAQAEEVPVQETQSEEPVTTEVTPTPEEEEHPTVVYTPELNLTAEEVEALSPTVSQVEVIDEENPIAEIPDVNLHLSNGETLIPQEQRTGQIETENVEEPQVKCVRNRSENNDNNESNKEEEKGNQEDSNVMALLSQVGQLNQSIQSLQQMSSMLMLFSLFNQNSIQFFPTAAQNANPIGSLSTIIYGQMMANLMSNNLPAANIAGAQAAQPTYQIMGDLNFLGNGLGANSAVNGAGQAFNQMQQQVNSPAPFGYNFDAGQAMTSPLAIL